MFDLIILTVAGILNSVLGLTVYIKDPRSVTNRLFLFLTLSFTTWSVANFISVNPVFFDQIIWVRIVIALAALLCLSVFLTFTVYPSRVLVGSAKVRKVAVAATLGVMALALSPFVFRVGASGEPEPYFGIPFFMALVVSLLAGGLYNLIRKYQKSHGQERKQLKLVIAGLISTFSLILISNFLMVIIFNNTSLVTLGSAYMLLFIAVLAYGIIKQKLFNIRSVIARSLGYVFSVVTLVAIFGLGTQGIYAFLTEIGSDFATIVANVVLIMFITLSYQPLKTFFDRQTNRIFYRDAYEPQAFLDELNSTIVGNIEIGILLRHTASVIEQNLKADCHIYVKGSDATPSRIMGTSQLDLKPDVFDLIRHELATLDMKTVVSDELGVHYSGLKEAMNRSNIALISSLITNYTENHDATAYLILGPKKSGNAYSKQDIRIINIITDELLIAIQNALRFEEIQSFNITLQNRINDATAKLKRSNEKLKEMDETKDEFISMASHQLRTPLTSVKGYLSMVIEGDAGKVTEQQQQLLNQAYVSSQRMVYLIADLLNVSRLKTGKFIIDRNPTNLAEMVESEIAQLKEVAKGRKLTLTFNKPEDFPILDLDETKTRQVVMNFVDNAIYYTPSGGKIKIELRADRSSVYFMVKDNGLGVPKSEQSHLFTKFYRAKNAQKARPDGTGLGLFMAKKVISDQGGTILFESVEGKGSTFGFKFDKPKDD